MDVVENIEDCVDRFAAGPKPYHDSCVSIDFSHVLNLRVPLIDVALVDRIDPDPFIEVPRYLHDLPVAQDWELGYCRTPCVRERMVLSPTIRIFGAKFVNVKTVQ